jgi:hypothetical protein
LRSLRRPSDRSRPAGTPPAYPIVHCSHHKAGTVWFDRILTDLASTRGLTFATSFDGGRMPEADVAVYSVVASLSDEEVARAFRGDQDDLAGGAARFLERSGLRPGSFRGTHLVRDPRDMVVSGWHYHLHCTEPWALTPRKRWGGRSYQTMLNQLDQHDGLLAEIQWAVPRTLVHMALWDYRQPDFLELRYEELLAEEVSWFTRIFEHYGFGDAQVEQGLAIAERYSRRNVTAGDHHQRSGEPGEWREFFGPEHIALFKEQTGHLLITLGYEADLGW